MKHIKPCCKVTKRIARKKGQHGLDRSNTSDLYTDENPKGYVNTWSKFATVQDAKDSVKKIESSGKIKHMHNKIQTFKSQWNRDARVMGKSTENGYNQIKARVMFIVHILKR